MEIKKLMVGPLGVNCYIIADEVSKEAMVIDPGDEPDSITDLIKEAGYKITAIVCTHAHFDHIGAVGDIKKATGAKVLINENDMELYKSAREQAAIWGYEVDDMPDPDGCLAEGDSVNIGSLSFKVISTPGHSPGGICLYGEGIVITGDTLFQGSVGRTDFHGGDITKLKESFKRLLSLPEDTAVFCGHGPDTTIKREKEENLFVGEFL
ncbi:MAG TPA: MBL fold metallo-hydrolase [Nitrospirae bacterium]|nr:putative metallo-hydrolase [bacterium BMS3Abin10]GBE39684.1 putative metallo-hydrolase [bacterium BMS3Bbin08]HDH50701.1 MBL fold metallo-hydrolase [Nitrospirota bacterium]HDK16647.1 MBL fold metallo-hydrolase [Nitrospirota bacterium]HDK41605.1 MBL fold metallo-hydrolase [Nitrospirota bacterium]